MLNDISLEEYLDYYMWTPEFYYSTSLDYVLDDLYTEFFVEDEE